MKWSVHNYENQYICSPLQIRQEERWSIHINEHWHCSVAVGDEILCMLYGCIQTWSHTVWLWQITSSSCKSKYQQKEKKKKPLKGTWSKDARWPEHVESMQIFILQASRGSFINSYAEDVFLFLFFSAGAPLGAVKLSHSFLLISKKKKKKLGL